MHTAVPMQAFAGGHGVMGKPGRCSVVSPPPQQEQPEQQEPLHLLARLPYSVGATCLRSQP